MTEHILKAFDSDLEDLRRHISEMGGIAEKMLADSITSLVRRDTPLAQSVIAADARLDVLQREVEEHAILMIARRQPLAVDLRETISAIRISGDVERIGDLAKNIAKRALAIAGQFQPQKVVVGLQHMSDLAMAQLKDVLDAYAQQDSKAALDVWHRDGQIDSLYTSLVPRAPHLHDGGSAQHLVLHAPALRGEERRAHRRPHDEHRRDDPLPRHRRDPRHRQAEERPIELCHP